MTHNKPPKFILFFISLDEEKKRKIKDYLYYLICFFGIIGYAIFELMILGLWLLIDLVIALLRLQKMIFAPISSSLVLGRGAVEFVIECIIVGLQSGKHIIGFILRRIGWGDFDFSNNGTIKVIRNIFKELRPSKTTFRFGILTLIIGLYWSITSLINNTQSIPQANRDSYQNEYYEEDYSDNSQSNQISPSPSPTPSINPSPTPSVVDQTNATIVGESGYKNIRSGPGTNYSKKHIAYPGDRVKVLDTANDRGGYVWYKIYLPESGAEGWIAGQLLSSD